MDAQPPITQYVAVVGRPVEPPRGDVYLYRFVQCCVMEWETFPDGSKRWVIGTWGDPKSDDFLGKIKRLHIRDAVSGLGEHVEVESIAPVDEPTPPTTRPDEEATPTTPRPTP